MTAALLAALGSAGYAQPANFTRILSNADVIAVTGETNFFPSGIAADASGRIYLMDTGPALAATDDRLLRITVGPPLTIEIVATAADFFAAVDAANGTSTATAFNGRQIAIDSNGDVIVLGFTSGFGDGDALLRVTTNPLPGTVSVIYTPTDANVSAINGGGGLTVLGGNAYVVTDRSNGTANEVIRVALTGPPSPTVIVSETDLVNFYTAQSETFTPAQVGLTDLHHDGVDLIGATSQSPSGPQDIIRITTSGVISRIVSNAQLVGKIQTLEGNTNATTVGFNALTVDGAGNVWASNRFGTAASAFDDTVLVIQGSGASADISWSPTKTQLQAQMGIGAIPFIANDCMTYDPASNRVFVAERGAVADRGLFAAEPPPSSVADWNLF
jgi:hypothetical protein